MNYLQKLECESPKAINTPSKFSSTTSSSTSTTTSTSTISTSTSTTSMIHYHNPSHATDILNCLIDIYNFKSCFFISQEEQEHRYNEINNTWFLNKKSPVAEIFKISDNNNSLSSLHLNSFDVYYLTLHNIIEEHYRKWKDTNDALNTDPITWSTQNKSNIVPRNLNSLYLKSHPSLISAFKKILDLTKDTTLLVLYISYVNFVDQIYIKNEKLAHAALSLKSFWENLDSSLITGEFAAIFSTFQFAVSNITQQSDSSTSLSTSSLPSLEKFLPVLKRIEEKLNYHYKILINIYDDLKTL
eukprot:TRINITY_DN577_c0_g2_i1.p1 TRINITY_DN577_c0_g2~~TRINITY_DN577_c0_g2_i1.p1  ORF type:complete len:300 (-),score=78.63 TRINITY_DN577_c0_g2_i1:30-929(-)